MSTALGATPSRGEETSGAVDPTAGGSVLSSMSPEPSAFAQVVASVGGQRAIPARAACLVQSGGGQAQVTIRLDTESGGPPTWLQTTASSPLGRGWAGTSWSELCKAETLAMRQGPVAWEQERQVWPGNPPAAEGPTVVAPLSHVHDLLKRHQSVLTAWPQYPKWGRLRLEPDRVVSANLYQLAVEPQTLKLGGATFHIPGPAVRTLLAQPPDQEVRLGSWDGGALLEVGELRFWSWDPAPFWSSETNTSEVLAHMATRSSPFIGSVATTAKDIRAHARVNKGVELDPQLRFVQVEYQGAQVLRSLLANVGKHLRGAVTFHASVNIGAPFFFEDEHGAAHFLEPLREPVLQ